MKLRGLYALTPEGADLERKLRAALEGGLACVQYRRKQATRDEAVAVVQLCREFAVPVIVNDDVELALEVDADGAHLGRDDGDLVAARKRLGKRILGASCYNEMARARAAAAAGADYLAFGSVFASPTKPAALRAPLALFEEASSLGVPLAAIGGITAENAPQLVRAGASLVAVISDLFDAPDIAARARQYGKLFA